MWTSATKMAASRMTMMMRHSKPSLQSLIRSHLLPSPTAATPLINNAAAASESLFSEKQNPIRPLPLEGLAAEHFLVEELCARKVADEDLSDDDDDFGDFDEEVDDLCDDLCDDTETETDDDDEEDKRVRCGDKN